MLSLCEAISQRTDRTDLSTPPRPESGVISPACLWAGVLAYKPPAVSSPRTRLSSALVPLLPSCAEGPYRSGILGSPEPYGLGFQPGLLSDHAAGDPVR